MAKKATTTKRKVVEVPVNNSRYATPKKAIVPEKNNKEELLKAISFYQQDINIDSNISNECLTDEQKKCVETLDKAMCPLSEMILTQVTIASAIDVYKKQADVKNITDLVGKTLINVPFMSTTKRPFEEVIKRRYDMGIGQPVCILIHTNEKLKGLDVEIETEKKDAKQEIILARNQQFLVKRVEIANGCGETYPILHFYAG